MGEDYIDRRLVDAVHRMSGCRRAADYYLEDYRSLRNHVDFAREAERAYREADQLLQGMGVIENTHRQSIIHVVNIIAMQERR